MTDRMIARRGIVTGGMASALLAGCATCGNLKPLAATDRHRRIGDAHAHFFNAADLPIAGFLRYVLIPEYAPNLPEVALAFAGIGASVLKRFAITASAEQKAMRPPRGAEDAPDISYARYANAVADTIEQATRRDGLKALAAPRPLERTEDSFLVLAILLAEASARSKGAAGPFSAPSAIGAEAAQLRAVTNVDREFLAQIAEQGSAAPVPTSGAFLTTRGAKAAVSFDVGGVWAAIRWCWLMVQSRCYHVQRYLAFADTGDAAVTDTVNLLVDYDAWLDDAPRAGSAMADQVRFWTDYAGRAASRLTIHTFAGYDPLRHVESGKPDSREPRYFETLRDWAKGTDPRHRIAGFKLYPPMGFKVFGNVGAEPAKDRSGAWVRDKWQRNGWNIAQFGAELDAALDTFFALCLERDIPVLAHGVNSNSASTGTGRMANPRWWLMRAERAATAGGKLRACIAHFEPRDPATFPALKALLALNRAGKANVYLDIGYADEFLDGRGKALLDALANVFGSDPKNAKFLLFGSDWIMLAKEPQAGNYVASALAAFAAHPFWQKHIDDVFGGNLGRFLNGMP